MGSHLGAGSNPERVFKGTVVRCKATTPSSLSLDGAVSKSSTNLLIGTGFASRYRLQSGF